MTMTDNNTETKSYLGDGMSMKSKIFALSAVMLLGLGMASAASLNFETRSQFNGPAGYDYYELPSSYSHYGMTEDRVGWRITGTDMPSDYNLTVTVENQTGTVHYNNTFDWTSKNRPQVSPMSIEQDTFGDTTPYKFGNTYTVTAEASNGVTESINVTLEELVSSQTVIPESSQTYTLTGTEPLTFSGDIQFNENLSSMSLDLMTALGYTYDYTATKTVTIPSDGLVQESFTVGTADQFNYSKSYRVDGHVDGGTLVNSTYVPSTEFAASTNAGSQNINLEYNQPFAVESASVSAQEVTVQSATDMTVEGNFQGISSDGNTDTVTFTLPGVDASAVSLSGDSITGTSFATAPTISSTDNGAVISGEVADTSGSASVSFTLSNVLYSSTGQYDVNVEYLQSDGDSVADIAGVVQVNEPPLDSYIVGQSVTGTIEGDFTFTPDYNHEDGDVTYYYKKNVLVKDGSVVESGNWERIQFDQTYDGQTNVTKTLTRDVNVQAQETGEYSARIEVAEASSTYNWDSDNDGTYTTGEGNWESYTTSKVGDTAYEYQVVAANQTPSAIDALGSFFGSIVDGIVSSIVDIFDTEPTAVPQPDNPPTPSSQP